MGTTTTAAARPTRALAFTPLTPVLIAALAATVESLTRLRERASPTGRLIPLHNRNLHIIYTSPTALHHARSQAPSPCVVLEAGANSWSPMWEAVAARMCPRVRVFRYDRPGFGFSDPAPLPRPVTAAADDLVAALHATGAHPPYILVAHSLGALYVNAAVRTLPPAHVAGLVYVDAASLETVRMLEPVVTDHVPPRWFARTLAVLGLLRVLAPLLLRPYRIAFATNPLRRHARATWARADWLRSYTAEWAAALDASRHATPCTAGWLGSLPIAVIVPDIYERTAGKAYIAVMQRAVANYSNDAVVIPVPDCGHFVQIERPDVVASAIDDVIARANHNASAAR